ncbi:hypothetical protein DIPPA_02474 [Diplonema papillatum]|nr:hypothetical protein DIPPA_02474 [Diplonema papillatum]
MENERTFETDTECSDSATVCAGVEARPSGSDGWNNVRRDAASPSATESDSKSATASCAANGAAPQPPAAPLWRLASAHREKNTRSSPRHAALRSWLSSQACRSVAPPPHSTSALAPSLPAG